MFERYTEKARRAIFFARYEASQFGSPTIESEHLLLGLIREDKAFSNRFLGAKVSFESIRKQVEGHTTIREAIATSVDLPISNECKRVLAYAAEEAERLSHKHIGTEHLMLGLLREKQSFATGLLEQHGLRLTAIREALADTPHVGSASAPVDSTSQPEWLRDLTQAARSGQLETTVGRELEIDGVIEILCCCYKNSPLLIGAPGAGRTAIVEGLAQRIAHEKAPSCLADKKIIALKSEALRMGPRERQRLDELINMAHGGGNGAQIIVFFDELQSESEEARAFSRVLLRAGVQCIGIMHTLEGVESRVGSWPNQFRAVHVRPLDEESSLAVLTVRKGALQAFHGVTYTEEALHFAVRAAASYLRQEALPGKAVALLDAAGSWAKLHQPEPPIEIAEAETQLRSTIDRMEKAIANHEFEKARYYSEEERKQRGRLQELREKHHLGEAAAPVVRPEELKQLIARWTAYPYCP